MYRTLLLLALAVFSVLCCTAAIAQNAPEPNLPVIRPGQEIRLIDKPDEAAVILPNGLAVIVKENHTAPVAAVRIHVRAGSIYEQEYLGAGLSHIFEHLLAGGATATRSEEQSRQLVEQIGAYSNAFTSKAKTVYFLTVPAQHVAVALNLLADWVTQPVFPPDAFKREWDVVQRELEMYATDPQHQLWSLFDSTRYRVHPARFPIIGYQGILQRLTRDDVLAYYRRMYVPANMAVVIVGHINAQEMLEQVVKEFAAFAPQTPPTFNLPAEPAVCAPRRVVQVFPAMQGPAQLVCGFPSFDLFHDDLYALDTLANIVGQGKSSRLYQILHEQRKLVLDIGAFNYTPQWAEGTFTIYSTVMPENVPALEAALDDVLREIGASGVTVEELERAKRQIQGDYVRSHQTAQEQADTLAANYLETGDPHFSDRYIENMQHVTVEQVQAAAQRYFQAAKKITVILTPVALASVREAAAAAQPEQTPIRKIVLDNGLRVLLRRDASVPLVNMQCYFLGGLIQETDADNGITNLMVQLSAKGTADFDAQQISRYFDSVGGILETGCGNNTFFYKAEVLSDDFPQAFNIFTQVIRQPTFPQDQLDKLRAQVLAQIEQQNNDWPQASLQLFRRSFFTENPYRRFWLGTRESVPALARQGLADFHRRSLAARQAVLTIFGAIDLEQVESLVRTAFADMPGGESLDLAAFKTDPAAVQPRRIVEKTEKTGAAIVIGFPGLRIVDVDDRLAIEVVRQIVGSTTGWLHEELRGRGLVYYAWGLNFPGLLPGYIAFTAQCESGKSAQVLAVINEQLDKARQGLFTEEQLARAKSSLINSEVLDKQTIADAAAAAALDELYGLGYDWSQKNAERIMAVSLAQLQTVTRKYLSQPATTVILTSDPEMVKEP